MLPGFGDTGGNIPPLFESPHSKKRASKRKLDTSIEGGHIAAKQANIVTQPKSALCTLHEMYRGLVFNTESQEGPVHAPIFTVSVEINGTVFEGKGKNKKIAKHNAAESALRSLVQFKNPTRDGLNLCPTGEMMDFTSDVSYKDVNNFDASKSSPSSVSVSNGGANGLLNKKTVGGKTKFQGSDKSPVMLLNELHPNTIYEVVSDNGEQYNKYTMAVMVDDKKFTGTGPSKKLSKAAAARSALAMLYNLSFSPAASPMTGKPVMGVTGESSTVPQVFADHISKLVIQKFTDLMENNPTHIRRKVLAGMVLSHGYDQDSCVVVSVTTGTKCINGERMSVNGSVLNDSHAEIVSRRCLNNFFYTELEKFLNPSTSGESIFQMNERGGGMRLKNDYKFHLFINTAPCGDSRIFSPHDECSVDKHPNRKARGQLRTKIESGEGTIPVKSSEGIQTWDGVLQGERLLTMSCSDKIAKWNVVGLQGALLSNFIEPIYLDSIVLGSLFHPDHLYRAVCGRIENTIHALPPPFRLNKPKMSLISSKEVRQPGKAPNFSVNWTLGDSGPEIVNAITGRTEQNQTSRVAKCKLFVRFLRLVGHAPSMTPMTLDGCPRMYSECKEKALNYQMAKKQLYDAFSKAELGNWVKKPIEADQFEWNEQDLILKPEPPSPQ